MKFKKMYASDLLISVDRLTRFKNPQKKYKRVFFDIITKFLIEPKLSHAELEEFEAEEICSYVEKIFNSSVVNSKDDRLNKILIQEETGSFVVDSYTKKLIEAKLDLAGCLEILRNETQIPLNVLRLFEIQKGVKPAELQKKGFLYPIKKIILCEGITEETLLEKLAELAGFNFSQNGIYVLGAGGKNQVARKFFEMKENLKLPVFILFDSDAKTIAQSIIPALRKDDKLYLIKSGEFEDILPKILITRALNKRFQFLGQASESDFQEGIKMTQQLHDLYRMKGWGEFKKAEFALLIKEALCEKNDLSNEAIEIINLIKSSPRAHQACLLQKQLFGKTED